MIFTIKRRRFSERLLFPGRAVKQLRGNTLLNNTSCVAELGECFA
jgi:hypothetical protein